MGAYLAERSRDLGDLAPYDNAGGGAAGCGEPARRRG